MRLPASTPTSPGRSSRRADRPGFVVAGPVVVPDGEAVGDSLRDAVAAGHAVVITTGGTGLTPERPHARADQTRCRAGGATARSGDRPVRRDHGVPTAVLSRGVAGVADRTLIVNLPGSRGGAGTAWRCCAGAETRRQPAARWGPLSRWPSWSRPAREQDRVLAAASALTTGRSLCGTPASARADAPSASGRLGAGTPGERQLAATLGGHPASGARSSARRRSRAGPCAQPSGPRRADAALAGLLRRGRRPGETAALAGQLTVSGIVGGSASWGPDRLLGRPATGRTRHHPDGRGAGGGLLLRRDGLHRIEIAIRPENTKSLRVVAKLGFRPEGLRPRYLHIDGDWRDHLVFALNAEEVPEGCCSAGCTCVRRVPDSCRSGVRR